MRKITSMTSLISFILVIVTSVILYIAPHGRVANWADWRFWGMTKTEWTNIHINLGMLFLFAILLHAYYNWKPIMSYMKNKARSFRMFTPSFNTGLVLSAVFIVGTLLYIPPFSTFIDFSETIKEDAAEFWGEPPYGHAELSSLSTFASKMGYDLDQGLAQLRDAGVEFEDASQTLLEIADQNGLSPNAIYLIMRPEETGEVLELPATSPEGLGNLTVAAFSQKYGLDEDQVLAVLRESGAEAEPDSKFRAVAESASTTASDLYVLMYEKLADGSGGDSVQAAPDIAPEGAPTGLGRLTLAELCEAHGFDQDAAMEILAAQGMEPALDAKVKDLATSAGLTPEDIYNVLNAE